MRREACGHHRRHCGVVALTEHFGDFLKIENFIFSDLSHVDGNVAEGQILIDVRLDGHIVTGVGHVEQRVFIAPLRQWAAIQPDQIFAALADSPCGKIVEHSAVDISDSVDLRGLEYYRYRA